MSAPNLNPMGLTSGIWPGNYVHPDVTAHPVSALVASYPVGRDILLNGKIVSFVEPLSIKDLPKH
jgi:hypothetical protein